MLKKFSVTIRDRLLHLLEFALGKDFQVSNFDSARRKLRARSNEFKSAIVANGELSAILTEEIYFNLCENLNDFNISESKTRLLDYSGRLFENLLKSIHSNDLEKPNSQFRGKIVYQDIQKEVQALSKSALNVANPEDRVNQAAQKIFASLTCILEKLCQDSDQILTNYQQKYFDVLLAALHSDRDQAALIYIQIENQIRNRCHFKGLRQPEASAVEVMNRVARSLLKGAKLDADSPLGYFEATAKLVINEYQRKLENSWIDLDDLNYVPPSLAVNIETTEEREKLLKLEEQLDRKEEFQLSTRRAIDDCRAAFGEDFCLLIDCYEYGDGGEQRDLRKMLAEILELNENALRQKVYKAKKKLDDCVAEKIDPIV